MGQLDFLSKRCINALTAACDGQFHLINEIPFE